MKSLVSLLCVLASLLTASDQIPAAAQSKPVLIQNGTLHSVSQGVLQGVDLLFDKGVITRMEKGIVPTAEMTLIDATGKHIYPGLIAAVSSLGLVEISAVRASLDYDEVGELTPEVRANVSYNPDSESIPVTRSNGVLFVNVTPLGGRIPGQSSLMVMDGWSWEDATFQHPTAMLLNWPDMSINLDPMAKLKVPEQEAQRRQSLKELDDLMDRVRAYQTLMEGARLDPSHTMAHDLRLEALIPYVQGTRPFFIQAWEARQIEAAVDWSLKQQVKIVIVGGQDAWQLMDLLKRHEIPVIVEETLRLPARRDSDYQEPYSLPAKLQAAGIPFCISTAGNGFSAPLVRDLPNHAAMAAAFGLSRDEALRSITLSAAEILGVAERIGSLDVGKEATLFIADGDILEITSHVEQAFIHGTTTDMNDKHKQLYHKYQEKYRRLGLLTD